MSISASDASPERLQQWFIASQRQALLGSLSGIIAHEYNNLMTPVLARAQDAVSRNDVAAMRKALAVTLTQTRQALDFTRQVLEVARGEELPVRACSVGELVDAAITAAVRPFERDGIELVLHVPSDLEVRAQPLLFVQVLLNLLLNARAAMKDRCGKLSISACREDDRVLISVCDAGVGMSPEMLNDVINPFLQTRDQERPGDWGSVGLGLLACRTIAQQHGATLNARNNDGPGCTFRLVWPAP
ncbi:MAG: HAMP domain-containing histidine kinase [Planctomycetes bacterium]|nr:HAMP domain-containing histidine kinase [Planctomycetota bacterium]